MSRFDKQRCITASFIESAYLISKFAEFYVLSCWGKVHITNTNNCEVNHVQIMRIFWNVYASSGKSAYL